MEVPLPGLDIGLDSGFAAIRDVPWRAAVRVVPAEIISGVEGHVIVDDVVVDIIIDIVEGGCGNAKVVLPNRDTPPTLVPVVLPPLACQDVRLYPWPLPLLDKGCDCCCER